MNKESILFEITNEFRTWYCVRYTHSIDYDVEHEKRKLYMYQARVGYAGVNEYRFRNKDDRMLFLIRFGMK